MARPDVVIQTTTIREMLRKKEQYDLEAWMQREKVWKMQQKYEMINSVMRGYGIPEITVIDNPRRVKSREVVDGIQRTTTLFDFFTNELKVKLVKDNFEILNEDEEYIQYDDILEDVDISEVEEEDELLKNFKMKIFTFKDIEETYPELAEEMLDTKISVKIYRNMTVSDAIRLFYRLNNGTPLSSQEFNRIAGGPKVMGWLDEITSQSRFLLEKVGVADKKKERKATEEVVIMCTMLDVYGRDFKGFSKSHLFSFQGELRDGLLTEEFKERTNRVFDYLYDASNDVEILLSDHENAEKERFNMMKKINMPLIYRRAIAAIDKGYSSERFAEWLISFFSDIPEEYGKYINSNTAQRSYIVKRDIVMENHFNNFFGVKQPHAV